MNNLIGLSARYAQVYDSEAEAHFIESGVFMFFPSTSLPRRCDVITRSVYYYRNKPYNRSFSVCAITSRND